MAAPWRLIGQADGAGGNLGGENSPNTTPPVASRIHAISAKEQGQGVSGFLAMCLDGTSQQITLWSRETRTGLWIQLHATATATLYTGGPAVKTALFDVRGHDIFARLETNTGNVKRIAWCLV
jgi:hypothetical protein